MSPLVIKCDQAFFGNRFGGRRCAYQGLVGGAMSYVTVFEITHEAIPLWVPLSFLIFGLFATIFLLLTRDLGCITKIIRYSVFLFACLWVVLLLTASAIKNELYKRTKMESTRSSRGPSNITPRRARQNASASVA